ncbi:hypothetical protein KGM_210532 [Danaus plexippus plexippus]|uniref:Uncharacterized protein n=1 Tax=Danaus plexippus plexippus TaxID=278856 RepID=A0A212EGV1_DANPL|nr:hypothetical protein KGM_210532 [Danaus plexippus plexippus]
MAIINQVISTAMISYVCTSLGLLYTLPSSTVELFSSEAVKSIQFYRGLKKNCSEISREVECIRKILNFDCGNNDSDEKQSLKKDDIPSEKLSFIQILSMYIGLI